MPFYQVTHVFNSFRRGWSETWYTEASTHAAALGKGTNLAGYRIPLLGKGNILEMVRASDVAIRGDSQVYFLSNNQATSEETADNPANAILTRIESGPLYRRPFLLRGLPDDWIIIDITHGGILDLDGTGLFDAFSTFKARLISEGFLLRVISKDVGDVGERAVTAVAAGDPGTTLLTVDGTGIEQGDTVHLVQFASGSVEDARLYNGVWRVLARTATTVTIPLDQADVLVPGVLTLGKLHRRIVKYVPIDAGQIIRAATRQTGRAFFVSAGRRPRRR